jgi:hypothetical protein
MMAAYIEFARNRYLLPDGGTQILDRSAYPDLLRSSNESFALFADSVCVFAKLHGWPNTRLQDVVI